VRPCTKPLAMCCTTRIGAANSCGSRERIECKRGRPARRGRDHDDARLVALSVGARERRSRDPLREAAARPSRPPWPARSRGAIGIARRSPGRPARRAARAPPARPRAGASRLVVTSRTSRPETTTTGVGVSVMIRRVASNPSEDRQADVHGHDVRSEATRHLDGLDPVRRLSDDRQVQRIAPEDRHQELPDRARALGHQDADHAAPPRNAATVFRSSRWSKPDFTTYASAPASDAADLVLLAVEPGDQHDRQGRGSAWSRGSSCRARSHPCAACPRRSRPGARRGPAACARPPRRRRR